MKRFQKVRWVGISALMALCMGVPTHAEQTLAGGGASASASVAFKIVIPAQIEMSASEDGLAAFGSNLPRLQIVVDEYSLADLGASPGGIPTAALP